MLDTGLRRFIWHMVDGLDYMPVAETSGNDAIATLLDRYCNWRIIACRS